MLHNCTSSRLCAPVIWCHVSVHLMNVNNVRENNVWQTLCLKPWFCESTNKPQQKNVHEQRISISTSLIRFLTVRCQPITAQCLPHPFGSSILASTFAHAHRFQKKICIELVLCSYSLCWPSFAIWIPITSSWCQVWPIGTWDNFNILSCVFDSWITSIALSQVESVNWR